MVGWLADRGNKCYNLTLLTPSACKAPIAHPEVRPILDQACVKERRLEKDKERIWRDKWKVLDTWHFSLMFLEHHESRIQFMTIFIQLFILSPIGFSRPQLLRCYLLPNYQKKRTWKSCLTPASFTSSYSSVSQQSRRSLILPKISPEKMNKEQNKWSK